MPTTRQTQRRPLLPIGLLSLSAVLISAPAPDQSLAPARKPTLDKSHYAEPILKALLPLAAEGDINRPYKTDFSATVGALLLRLTETGDVGPKIAGLSLQDKVALAIVVRRSNAARFSIKSAPKLSTNPGHAIAERRTTIPLERLLEYSLVSYLGARNPKAEAEIGQILEAWNSTRDPEIAETSIRLMGRAEQTQRPGDQFVDEEASLRLRKKILEISGFPDGMAGGRPGFEKVLGEALKSPALRGDTDFIEHYLLKPPARRVLNATLTKAGVLGGGHSMPLISAVTSFREGDTPIEWERRTLEAIKFGGGRPGSSGNLSSNRAPYERLLDVVHDTSLTWTRSDLSEDSLARVMSALIQGITSKVHYQRPGNSELAGLREFEDLIRLSGGASDEGFRAALHKAMRSKEFKVQLVDRTSVDELSAISKKLGGAISREELSSVATYLKAQLTASKKPPSPEVRRLLVLDEILSATDVASTAARKQALSAVWERWIRKVPSLEQAHPGEWVKLPDGSIYEAIVHNGKDRIFADMGGEYWRLGASPAQMTADGRKRFPGLQNEANLKAALTKANVHFDQERTLSTGEVLFKREMSGDELNHTMPAGDMMKNQETRMRQIARILQENGIPPESLPGDALRVDQHGDWTYSLAEARAMAAREGTLVATPKIAPPAPAYPVSLKQKVSQLTQIFGKSPGDVTQVSAPAFQAVRIPCLKQRLKLEEPIYPWDH